MRISCSSIGAAGGLLAPLCAAHLACAGDANFLPATPYVQISDSPFMLRDLGRTFILETFEGEFLNAPGASPAPGTAVFGPGPMSDSVDEDDGLIDGFGTAGRCWRAPVPLIMTWKFDATLLGGLPTQVGLVWTDGGPDEQTIQVSVTGPNGIFLGFFPYTVGDEFDGTTGDDRFIGVEFAGGIQEISIQQSLGAMEIDHLQYKLPVPFRAEFLDPAPYASTADSPFDIVTLGADHIVQDFESGSLTTFGATVAANFVIAPGAVTDSVDADDGVVDGDGAAGWSIAQFANAPLVVTFDAGALGGLPTEFAIVVTDVAAGEKRFRVQGFDAMGTTVGFRDYTVVGDDQSGGTTEEDRILAMVSDVPLSRVEVTALDAAAEFDHIQFNVPAASELSFIDPTPYLSVDDSPFGVAAAPDDYTVVDLEGGTVEAYLAQIDVDFVVGPSAFTDSVDGDDGFIDGSGTAGWSAAQLLGSPAVVTFDASDPMLLPTEFGVVVTDLAPGAGSVLLRGYDEDGVLLGQRVYEIEGDDSAAGTTAEDRFVGFTSTVGLGRVEITCTSSNFELDHLQYNRAAPTFLTFFDPAPYLSIADSPFGVESNPGSYTVIDVEDGTAEGFGASLDVQFLIAPSPATDSVDADDGVIDGSGTPGNSMAQLVGVPLTITFDGGLLDPLPTQFGVVVTDCNPGPQKFTLSGFGPDDAPLGSRTFTVTGDGDGNGATAEDRFLGFESSLGVAKVVIVCTTSNFELDHIQYNAAAPEFLKFYDEAPYLSVADSPFDLEAIPVAYTVVDVEDGTVDAFGATIDVQFLVGPSPITDSVDGDDGVIDGLGNDGNSMAQLANAPVTVTFDAGVLETLPTEFGVVVTDCSPGPQQFILRGFDGMGALLGIRTYTVVGDENGSGGTAEDRFLGFQSPVGVARVEIVCTTSNFELDHIQYNAAEALFGDVNGDGVIDAGDLGALLSAWGSDSREADLTEDGLVDGADLGIMLAILSAL